MKYGLLVLISIFGMTVVQAQIIDDSSIQKAEQSYDFVEGRFVAFLADTISPDYAEKAFSELNIPILNMIMKRALIGLVNNPSKESLEALQNHDKIYLIRKTPESDQLDEVNAELKNSNLNDSQKRDLKENLLPLTTYFVEFNYSVDIQEVKEIMGKFDDVEFKFLRDPERTVTLQAEAGNEPITMDKVEELNFVKGTAMMGVIQDY